MPPYSQVSDISERELEESIRRNPGWIEEGLVYVTHQTQAAGGRLDVLLVDSGRSLVVAELKVTQDDGMLTQALDYYDHVSGQAEFYARVFASHSIDPTQPVRLFLVAPSFSQTLINRCKYVDIPLSLFRFVCLRFEGEEVITPVFSGQEIPARPETIEVPNLDRHLEYITDLAVREKVKALLEEVKGWAPGNIVYDPIKSGISMKVNNRVFAYLYPRRKHFLIATFDADGRWQEYPVKGDEDMGNVKPMMRAVMESRR